jgi:type II secretory pathway component PulJ
MIEAIIAILLGALLVAAAWTALARERQALQNMIVRAEGLTTIRMARSSLARDVASAGASGVAVGQDTVGLRAVRGIGLPCSLARSPLASTSLAVRYTGIRNPNPRKDSIRGLTRDGAWVVSDLIDVTSAASCDTVRGTRALTLVASTRIETLVYAEVFEVGSYHLTGRALRYRGPGGNRQPLTAENVSPASRFVAFGPRVEIALKSSGVAPWSISLGTGGARR